ncbi:hypothetical protein BKI49_22240 [Streptomyces sp. Tue6028]|uniref:hypothetical protein n=1 Tax=Streptomyces sp. Tue6028 TaxID=2036037 RepID=UPI000BB30375|nr:hypothetical protein [Streptomyces sp. Tue6028]PBC61727.1 hypothetical protein BKI49_22240 [Streptomyces sp. Tue6028]
MNRAERRILVLLGQLAERDFVVVDDLGGSPRRLATLAYVAEQHGFRYAEAHRVGRALQIQLVRTERAGTAPKAEDSRAGTAPKAEDSRAGTAPGGEGSHGGKAPRTDDSRAVPGLRPGTLRPLGDAARTVRGLRDRIEFDAMAEDPSAWSRAAIMTGCALFVSLVCAVYGWRAALIGFAVAEALSMGFLALEVAHRRRVARRVGTAGLASG